MYKLYQSKQTIWWDNVIIENVPDWDDDSYFNFELVDSNCINFETYSKGKITVKDKTITYFKLEKENGETTYWFVKNVDKVLSNGVVYNLELDFWYTYTKRILRIFKRKDDYALIERTHFTTAAFYKNFENANLYIKYMTKADPIIDELEPQYELLFYESKQLSDQPIKAMGGGLGEGELTYGSSNNHYYNIGLYLVFVAKEDGSIKKQFYDFFPVMVPENEWLLHNNSTRINQSLTEILTTLAAKVTRYGKEGFLGLYKGPVILPKDNRYNITEVIDGKRFIYLSYDNMELITSKIPFNLNLSENTNMIDHMLRLQTDTYFGSTKRKLKHYFKNFDFRNKRARDEINLRFANGFLGFPKDWYDRFTIEDIESFGNILPSPSGDYNKALLQAQQQYDTSLSSMGTNFVTGLASSALAGIINPAFSVGGLIGSAGGLISGLIGNELNYKKAVAGASATFINSFTQDVFYLEMYDYLNRSYNLSGNTTKILLSNYGVKYNFNSEFKSELKYIYNRIGYPIYGMINMQQFFNDNTFRRRYYIKFDLNWVSINIRKWLRGSEFADLDSDVLTEISKQLSNGLLCWKTDTITPGDDD